METLIICGFCWVLVFIFTGMEAGILSLDRVKLRDRVQQRQPSALILDAMIRAPEEQLAVIFATNTLMQVAATVVFIHWVWRHPDQIWQMVVVSVLYLFGFIILAKLLPKMFFRDYPLRACLIFARPTLWMSKLLWPFVWFSIQISSLVLRLGGSEYSSRKIFVTRDEIRLLAQEKLLSHEISPEEQRMISKVFDFRYLKVREVMIPRAEMITISPEWKPAEVVEFAQAKGVSRLPVLDGRGQVQAVASVYDILFDPDHRSCGLSGYLHRPLFVQSDEPADAVLQKMATSRQPVAMVRDERERVVGLVTLNTLTSGILGRWNRRGRETGAPGEIRTGGI
ncbi:MAG: CNNM domain-containing protein [Verrucomicrobiae bacterium]|nr:CNNM domain-containing protein [Verrucomicrobiae bacterium]